MNKITLTKENTIIKSVFEIVKEHPEKSVESLIFYYKTKDDYQTRKVQVTQAISRLLKYNHIKAIKTNRPFKYVIA